MEQTLSPDTPCNLCSGTEVTVLSNRGREGNPLRTVACINCGLAWSDPRPHDSRQFYREQYRLSYKSVAVPKAKHVVRAGLVAISRLEKIRPYLQGKMRVLDVGSGGGEFAYLLASLGHVVHGVEPNEGYANYSSEQYGLDIDVGFIGDVSLPGEGFDLVTIWHVLEHTEDPGSVLRKLHAALRPDGVLVIEVPNIEATCQSPSSTFHDAHLYHFNTSNLAKLAQKSGFAELSTQLSPDGGNITMTLRRLSATLQTESAAFAIPNNHAQIASVVRQHTRGSHFLSMHPYRRFAGRMIRAVAEWRLTQTNASGRERLDALYSPHTGEPSRVAQHTPARLSGRTWTFIVGAYLLAIFAEWLLFDLAVPNAGRIDYQAVAIYVALQTMVVFAVARLSTIPKTKGQFAKLAAWAAPLFAIPAFC
jgi:2-polyprenyl-3-methyl-5-hydroxy-6-metoxy-1,4-benzoquinol methylase